MLQDPRLNVRAVRAHAERLLQRDWGPDSDIERSALHSLVSVLALLHGDVEGAHEEIRRADAFEGALPTARSFYALNGSFIGLLQGDLLLAERELNRAAQIPMRQIIPIFPAYVEVQRGLISWAEGKVDDADAAFQRALEVDPRNDVALSIAIGSPSRRLGVATGSRGPAAIATTLFAADPGADGVRLRDRPAHAGQSRAHAERRRAAGFIPAARRPPQHREAVPVRRRDGSAADTVICMTRWMPSPPTDSRSSTDASVSGDGRAVGIEGDAVILGREFRPRCRRLAGRSRRDGEDARHRTGRPGMARHIGHHLLRDDEKGGAGAGRASPPRPALPRAPPTPRQSQRRRARREDR